MSVAVDYHEFHGLTATVEGFPYLRAAIETEWKSRAVESANAAYEWLFRFRETLKLGSDGLTVNASDQAIKDSAEAQARKCKRAIFDEMGRKKKAGASEAERLAWAVMMGREVAATTGVNWEISDKDAGDRAAVVSMLARLCCPKWWRRQLRVVHARSLETAARELGLVHKRAGGYVSRQTLGRRREQRRRNADLLERMEAVNDQGQVYTLAELAALGTSNPALRRAELMTRLRGFEEWAQEQGTDWVPLFFTLTAPPVFHSHDRRGRRYEKWDGSTPRDAQAHLCRVWANTRAEWARVGIEPFGFRIAEPHHDGCPHWHLLLWVHRDHAEAAEVIFRGYALDGDTDAASIKRRLTVVAIEPGKGSAVGYVSKYVSKNIDGLGEDGNEWSSDSVRTAVRVEAWASTWGIRQFQQIGGPGVTVWRELRRLDADALPELEEARAAADAGDWRGFVEAMGGAVLPRAMRPIRAADLRRDVAANEYGELMTRITGLVYEMGEGFALRICTRVREWTIRPKRPAAASVQLRAPPGRPLDLCQ